MHRYYTTSVGLRQVWPMPKTKLFAHSSGSDRGGTARSSANSVYQTTDLLCLWRDVVMQKSADGHTSSGRNSALCINQWIRHYTASGLGTLWRSIRRMRTRVHAACFRFSRCFLAWRTHKHVRKVNARHLASVPRGFQATWQRSDGIFTWICRRSRSRFSPSLRKSKLVRSNICIQTELRLDFWSFQQCTRIERQWSSWNWQTDKKWPVNSIGGVHDVTFDWLIDNMAACSSSAPHRRQAGGCLNEVRWDEIINAFARSASQEKLINLVLFLLGIFITSTIVHCLSFWPIREPRVVSACSNLYCTITKR